MKIKPLNNIVLAEEIEGSEQGYKPEVSTGIVLPDEKIGRFIKIKIIAVGDLVEKLKPGDIAHANPMLEKISSREKIGYINSKDILGVIK